MGRLFVAIGGLLVLVLTLALVVPPFIDWTGYRDRFEQEASRILGRTVHVNGTASARLLPFPSVTFSNVTVEGAEQEPMLTMEEFSMDAELLPFLRGQILIFDMQMEKPHLMAGLDKQGRLNWAPAANAALAGAHVRLEKLTINDGRITVQDDLHNRSQDIQNIQATLSADSLAGPWRVNGHMQMQQQGFGLEISTGEKKPDAGLRLRVRLVPDELALAAESDGEIRLDDGQPHYSGQFSLASLTGDERKKTSGTTIEPTALVLDKFRLSGQFTAKNDEFSISEFRMEQGEADAPYVINGNAQLDIGDNPNFMITADGQQVYLDGMSPQHSATVKPEVVVQPLLSFQEKLEFLQQMLARIPVPEIPGRIDLRLPAIIANGTTIRSVVIRAEPDDGAWNISQLQADLPGRTQIEAKGKLQLGADFGFQGNFLLASRQPSGFTGWLTGEAVAPALAMLPAAGFSGAISLNKTVQRIDDLEIVLGDTVLNGSFERSGGENRAASSTLSVDGKNLDTGMLQLLSGLLMGDGELTVLSGENLTVHLKAAPVNSGQLQAEQLDTSFRLSNGKLDFDRLLISGFEGSTLSATGSVRPFDHSVTATLDATILADDLTPVLQRLNHVFPREPFLSALASRAAAYPALFADTKLDLLINAENLFADGTEPADAAAPKVPVAPSEGETARTGRVKQKQDHNKSVVSDVAELSFSLNGQTGALILSVAGSSKGTITGSEPMQLSLTANARAASGEAALALLGMPVLPLGLMDEAELNLQAQGAPVEGMKTALEISGEDGRARLDGVMTLTGDDLTVSGKVLLQSDDLEPFLATAGYALPFGRGFGSGVSADLSSDFQFGKNIIRLPNLQGKFDDEAVNAKLDGSLSEQSVALLRGEIQLQHFDLAGFVAGMTGLSLSEVTSAENSDWSKKAFTSQPLLPLSLDLKLSAAQADMHTAEPLTDFSARIVKSDQELKFSDLAGQWAGGKISGQLELNNAHGTVLTNGDLRLSALDLAVFYHPEGQNPPVSGLGDIKLGFSGSGTSMAELVHSLAGEGAVSVENFFLSGLQPEVMSNVLSYADELSDKAQTDPKEMQAERVELAKLLLGGGGLQADKLQTSLSLAGGVIRAPAVKIITNAAELQADLQYDLNRNLWIGTSAVDLLLPVGERNDVSPQLRFSLSGSWRVPEIKTDTQPLIEYLTQRALLREQQRVEAAQALIIEKQRLKREADYFAAQVEKRKQQRLAAEAELRRRAAQALEHDRVLQQQSTPAMRDFKPSLDEFLLNLPQGEL